MRRCLVFGSLLAASTRQTVQSQENQLPPPSTPPEFNPDPKVVEFFKDFPEPYRQKAIEKYDTRDKNWLARIRENTEMGREKKLAEKGLFSQDQKQALADFEQKLLEQRQQDRQERRLHFHQRQIPAWEEFLLQWLPLHPVDRMSLKLLESGLMASCALISLRVIFTMGRDFKHLRPWKIRLAQITSAVFCFEMSKYAFYRLMDKGIFDRSVDERDPEEKFQKELQALYNDILDFFNDSPKA